MFESEKFESEIKSLLSLPENELFEKLGEEILPPTMGFFSPKQKMSEAKKWMEKHKDLLRSRVCGSVALQYNLYNPERYETVMTVATIMDLITGLFTGVPLNVVAVLIIKEGHKSFCGDEQSQ